MAGSKEPLQDYPEEVVEAWQDQNAEAKSSRPRGQTLFRNSKWLNGPYESSLDNLAHNFMQPKMDGRFPSLPYLQIIKNNEKYYVIKYRTANEMRSGGMTGVFLAFFWFVVSVALLFWFGTMGPIAAIGAGWLMSIISLGGSIAIVFVCNKYYHLTKWPMRLSSRNEIHIMPDKVQLDFKEYPRDRISFFQYRADETPANRNVGLTMRLGFKFGSVMIYAKEAVFSEIEAENVLTILNEIMLETGSKGYARPEPGYTPSFTNR